MNMQPPHYTTHEQTEAPLVSPLRLAAMTQQFAPSATLAMNEAVAQRRAAGRATIHLGFGEATFPLHPLLQSALADAAKHTGYAPVAGIPALRQAIAEYLSRTRGLNYTAADIIVAPGSKPLLYALLHILEGDVLLPVPSWVSYAPQARLAGRRVIDVATDPRDSHRLTPQVLSEALAGARKEGANPRILIVNSPSNPTGSMFARADVEAFTAWARNEGITVISDEIYAELAHGWREHVSPARFYPEGCIVTGGLSKAFSAGGWRLGYAALPPTPEGKQVATALRTLASEIWSSSTTPVQEAGIVAYTPNAELEVYVRRSARVHGYVTGQLYTTLTNLGIHCPRPAGAFYLYPDFAPWREALNEKGISTSQELAHYLLDEWDIATLPGIDFGEQAAALRLRLATSMLYDPDGAHSAEERDAQLWRLLTLADTLSPSSQANETALPLPALSRAQTQFTALIAHLNQP
jgi:aspartate aminotransferase